jgi:malate dehydrogenase (oxaloacetate-decarboxylating)(NADP+)
MNKWKDEFATTRDVRTLKEALVNADVFIGVSGPNLLTAEDVAKMAPSPLIFAMANPTPEIYPEEARKG